MLEIAAKLERRHERRRSVPDWAATSSSTVDGSGMALAERGEQVPLDAPDMKGDALALTNMVRRVPARRTETLSRGSDPLRLDLPRKTLAEL